MNLQERLLLWSFFLAIIEEETGIYLMVAMGDRRSTSKICDRFTYFYWHQMTWLKNSKR